ncbi:MAG: TolC family protein [Novosphingobium sp.]|uniref:TolC family protein n=1 Tax=Novosphingobium sp. TaxID=1874826 RepID=UPI00301A80C7
MKLPPVPAGPVAAALAVLLGASGCAPAPHLASAPPVEAAHWSLASDAPADGRPAVPADIATLLGSPDLAALVAQALAHNPDIAAASAGIDRATALLGAARLAALPSVSLSGGASREFGKDGSAFDFRSSYASLDVSWNLDPFGRISGPRRAALARVRAAEIQRDLVALAVETNVAQAFVLRASLARRIAILDEIIGRAVELERVVRVRYEAGAATRVDLGQQSMRVTNLRRSRTELVEALDRTRTALAVLCGAEAPAFAPAPAAIAAFTIPDLAPPSPARLLAARPDVHAREAIIAASEGDVRAARAAYYPALNLSAQGLLADFSGGALTRSVTLGASVLAPIFDRGRLRAGLKVSEAEQAAAVEDYRATVLAALSEVENLQRTMAAARERAALVSSITSEARLTARLAHAQYIEGEEDLWTQIDAEQLLANAEDAQVLSLQERLLAEIALYRAMGGYHPSNVAQR